MNMHLTKSQIGLDGVPAAETVLSHVDGERGELIIAGEHVADLAGKSSFEGVTARLWNGATGKSLSEANVRASLGAARERAFARLPDLLPATRGMSIVDGFRAAIAGLRGESGLEHEATIVGAFPVIAGALVQHAKGHDPIAPDPNAGHAADTLRMLLGRKVEPREVAALDAYLVTVCDHGMNASTFTTRVIASTQADLFAAITGGYCALTGPLHGGAPEPVLEMLDAIGTRERIKPWVDGALAHGERLMGFGHRVYRVRDPRADVLKIAIERLEASGADLPFAGEVEAYIREALRKKNPERPLETNVEFFTAILLDGLEIPRQAFTPIFATARAAGWTAHALEQRRTGRLIRPSSSYVGTVPKG
ncbi:MULTISPECIES: citrate synthase/methylcitrate synthase [Bradyrhizobium]|uniref:Citrate synthase n=3 Tax=Bradyrhizobium TaxID=374 RepID=A0ABY8JIK1_9BRAD|nr:MULTISPECIES: citrate synthase/methylcitrate synthase [Bradyrhizobium]MCP1836958.1 citrate synthase [Bradyrhizobium sp. USDA 4545]MCP1921706.1 citrate synthase [Bradyrhizobium sp. USDA 4532]OMI14723.1 citrate synthase/methylcitrate synthase [Bradyrhizobium brasilense]WFU63823.1 citrate synthase/methylcitrate synthase [Bradyrhizobium brasilense]